MVNSLWSIWLEHSQVTDTFCALYIVLQSAEAVVCAAVTTHEC